SRISFIVGKAEAIPLPDNSQDAVSSIFLFHELPPKIRRKVLSECARVLKPSGRLVLIDSLQRGDRPDYEGMLELFPQSYHEPYYESYTSEDFCALTAACGLTHIRTVNVFISKMMVFKNRAREEPPLPTAELMRALRLHKDDPLVDAAPNGIKVPIVSRHHVQRPP